jgi:predicted AlkP superfamily phosphohydrolase/phosphomutase
MKICVLGLDGAAPEVVFHDERMANLRRLMDLGVYGRLRSIVPPTAVPAWMCMAASQDPGSLGVYGCRKRSGYSYNGPDFANPASIPAPAIWDHVAEGGKKSIIIGVPPNYPPRQINGISIGCFLTPDPRKDEFVWPAHIRAKITELVGDYPVDVKELSRDRNDGLKDKIFSMSRKQWQVVRWLLTEQEWDYFHFVDIGLDRMHHGFWNCFDPQHRLFQPGNSYQKVIPEYYLWLDEQIGAVLELLDHDTIVLVVSAYGTQRLDGGFAVNDWLVREGLLVLNEYPKQITPFEKLSVNWSKTRVWSEGGGCARIFFNVQGCEPRGVISAADYESFQNEIKARLEALPNEKGTPPRVQVFKPKEIYRNMRGAAPDLIVCFDDLLWRSIGTVGHPQPQLHENNAELEGCSPTLYGMFVLASPNCPLSGEYQGATLLDIAPTLLDLGGYEIPAAMQGRSLVQGIEKKSPDRRSPGSEDQRIIHDRLAGLGYI